ncbi:DnaJ protein, putative [Plasmodium sp. gorilla clade G2]|uniref:DnaJ protein, putative n=1 Tax=Plasmodium sp. gorilla clade G2 TaxID=880535 RepID=UPI000D20E0BE|nr:DnaJ protein, putative [Plasmodium sp. gorilla clade G2]SOV14560.1 DnaJ protein, putative [Plasmodium sp. gorilla clade G2]
MRKKNNTKKIAEKTKEPNSNNTHNETTNYFNISEIKELYNNKNNNIYEKIFDNNNNEQCGRKRKRKKENIVCENSNNLSSIYKKKQIKQINILYNNKNDHHHNKEPITQSESYHYLYNPSFIKRSKTNNEVNTLTNIKNINININNTDPYSNNNFPYSNRKFDQTYKKSSSTYNTRDINKNYKIINESSNLQKNCNINKNYNINHSLNKYDFIRFVCSPNKSKQKVNDMDSPIKKVETKEYCKETSLINTSNHQNNKIDDVIYITNKENQDNYKNNINQNKNKIDITTQDENITKESQKIKNDRNIKMDKNIQAEKKKIENSSNDNIPLIDLNDEESINRLSKNFFINNKKFFINDISKDKLSNDSINKYYEYGNISPYKLGSHYMDDLSCHNKEVQSIYKTTTNSNNNNNNDNDNSNNNSNNNHNHNNIANGTNNSKHHNNVYYNNNNNINNNIKVNDLNHLKDHNNNYFTYDHTNHHREDNINNPYDKIKTKKNLNTLRNVNIYESNVHAYSNNIYRDNNIESDYKIHRDNNMENNKYNIYSDDNKNNDLHENMNEYIKENYKTTKSLYSYLDLSYNCSNEEIKKAYKEKIKVCHPDKGGNIKEFLQLKFSYDILSDKKKRKMYDKYGNSILELLISDNIYDYNISSDEKTEEEIIDEEYIKIYELFVQKYHNISYLHNLLDLKITNSQYNHFQKLIYHFCNMDTNIFKNILYLYPIYSPNISTYNKKSNTKKNENQNNTTISFEEQTSQFSQETLSENSSTSHETTTKEINIFDTIEKKNFGNLFFEINKEFDHFYKNYLIHKMKSTNQKNETQGINENVQNIYEYNHKDNNSHTLYDYNNEMETPLNSTPMKENIENKNKKNDNFFKDIQVSPVVYKIINEKNDKLMDDFYKWFEYFFDQSENDQQQKIQQNCETNKIGTDKYTDKNNNCNENNNTCCDYISIGEKQKNIANDNMKNDGMNNNNVSYIYEHLNKPNIKQNNHYIIDEKQSKHVNLYNIYQNDNNFYDLCNETPHHSIKKKSKSIKTPIIYKKDVEETQRIAYSSFEKKTYHSSYNLHNKEHKFINHPYCSPIKTNIRTNRLSPYIYSEEQNLNKTNHNHIYNYTLNVEEKYGFNLFKKSDHKIKDLTHDFNYIYIGNNMNNQSNENQNKEEPKKKKKNFFFFLFIKQECINNFLKIKLLIHKMKEKKNNLKLISLFQNQIDKYMKNMEYILLLTTYKEELIPLNDFYLLDKNIYTKRFYCIPIYIKKNNLLIRPNFFHIKWIVYTLQTLIFCNFFFKKINKYMCTYPFFNYKYTHFKKYINQHNEQENNDENDITTNNTNFYDNYIFFQHYIIKNKMKYVKYFPHHLMLNFKDLQSTNMKDNKNVHIHISPIFVLTPNKIYPTVDNKMN